MLNLQRCVYVSLLSFCFCAPTVQAVGGADPAAMKQWQDRRFGMFIHWGPVSLTGQEIGWSRGQQVPVEEYDQLYKQFNPTKFNARQWVKAAQGAGVKYIVLTTKHHDGFCLWDTKQTDYNIMNSPFGRDVVKELAAACKEAGIAFGTYYSTCDWRHPDFPRTSPGGSIFRATSNLDRYTEYLKAQVQELLVQYGPLSTIWFDVPQEFDAVRGQGVIDFVRGIQPDLIINDRTGAEGDYSTPEQRIGSFDRARPWETCMTICQQWAWKPDDNMKSLKECVRTLVYTVGGDGNLLFNVGPMPDGRIEPRQVKRLAQMGDWVKRYGDGIYGTRGGPFLPGQWGASTCKGGKIFLFVMQWPDRGPLVLPAIEMTVTGARALSGGDVTCEQTADGVRVNLPESKRREIASVIELTVDGQALDLVPRSVSISGSAGFGKPATASNVFSKQAEYGPDKALDDNDATRWATDGGVSSAWLEVDLGRPETIAGAMIDEGQWNRIKKFELQYLSDSEWKTAYAGTAVGAKRKISFEPFSAQRVRLHVFDVSNGPTIWEFQLYAASEVNQRESN